MKSICFLLGTRPEIIKIAPLIRRARARDVPFMIIHTGQHYDDALDGVFFRELGLPPPDANAHAAAPSVAAMIEKMADCVGEVWGARKPSVVVVQGDTNSALAGSLLAQKAGIPVAHVEAGLRSDDLTMPEEVNRIQIDGLAERLYVPTAEQAARLEKDGTPAERVLVTGNTVADAVADHLPQAASFPLPEAIDALAKGAYAIVTLHRPALVDDAAKLDVHFRAIDAVLSAEGVVGLFLCHPRTRARLRLDSALTALHVVDPIGYLPMLRLVRGAKLLVTDSGGLQEEAALLRVPCVTVRENTERPETIRAGGNRLVGFDIPALEEAVRRFLHDPIDWKPLYDVAAPSETILDDLVSRYL